MLHYIQKTVKDDLTMKEIFERRFEGSEHASINSRRNSRANNSIKVAKMRPLVKHEQ